MRSAVKSTQAAVSIATLVASTSTFQSNMSCYAQLGTCHQLKDYAKIYRSCGVKEPHHSTALHQHRSSSRSSSSSPATVVSPYTSSLRPRQLACRTAAVLQPYQLAAIAAEPVVKVALLSGAGALCAKQGILTLEGRRMLSGLIMNVFTPALVGG